VNIDHKIKITLKSRWLFLMACPVVAAAVVFCFFYLFSSYNYLAGWYLQINDCFYRHEHWQSDFFTAQTKAQGNILCIAGLLISAPLQYYLIKRLKRPFSSLEVRFSKRSLLMVILCMLISTMAWIWGYSLVHQGFDEVFSAVNSMSLPPFQTLSYYMLPNNHILFNLLNGTLFHFAADKVFTGKLISLVCLWGIIIVIFAWLSDIIKNRYLLALAVIVVCFQFPIWGFGFQARGYEFCSLTKWVAFLSIIRYLSSKNSEWLHYFALACVAGYLCIPVFLYFHAALVLFALFWMAYTRKTDVKFWKTQLAIVLIVYLLYLPAFCFSGVQAFTSNQYVVAKIHNLQEFYDKGQDIFTGYLNFYTSNFTKDHPVIDTILFLAPLALFLFYKNKPAILCGFFYLAMWLSWIGIAYAMKIYPIERAMTAHLSISLGLTVYVIYLLLSKLNELFKTPHIADIVFAVLLIGFGVRAGIGNEANISFGLYNNDINLKYNFLMQEGIDFIPKGSSIAFSDECFYWYYLCKLRGDKVNKCPAGNEQYFVRFGLDPLPISDTGKYVLVKTVFKHGITAVRYEIYKRE
jgi:hypothetical protein